ncbi:hypothetical protein DL95DRAFT_502589 [Leptodontidium sp. 2 PMI_412]|nr:hypothetical protein DL95DRAFT_502589 [Leptodontidium sp. 2 PMI_412]
MKKNSCSNHILITQSLESSQQLLSSFMRGPNTKTNGAEIQLRLPIRPTHDTTRLSLSASGSAARSTIPIEIWHMVRDENNISAFTRIMVASVYLKGSRVPDVCNLIGRAELQYLVMPVRSVKDLLSDPLAMSVMAYYLIRFLRNSQMCLLTPVSKSFIAKEITKYDSYLSFSPHTKNNEETSAYLPDLAAKTNINRGKSISCTDQLEVLHIQFSKALEDLTFGSTLEMFPPMRVLILEYYNWQHTKKTTDSAWDFSLIKKCLFMVEDDGDDFQGLITDLTVALPNLEEFILHDPWMHAINIPVFFRSQNNIIRLELLDTQHGEQMSAEDLAHLVRACPDLKVLKTNLDPERHDVQRFLNALTEFPKLNSVWLEVHTRQPTPLQEASIDDENAPTQDNPASEGAEVDFTDEDEDETPGNSADPTYDAAKSIIRNLHVEKVGVPFEKICIIVRNTEPPAGWVPAPEALRYGDYVLEGEGEQARYTNMVRLFGSYGRGQEAEEVWAVNYL